MSVKSSTPTQVRYGTVFPLVVPHTNYPFFRTDLGVLCHHDGTRWLGPPVHHQVWTTHSANPTNYSGTALTHRFSPPSPHNWWVVAIDWQVRVNTTNNGSNYWTLRLGHETNGFGGAVDCDVNTSGWSSSLTLMRNVQGTSFSGQPYDFATPGSYSHFFLEVRKDNGSPGTLDVYGCLLTLRRVYV